MTSKVDLLFFFWVAASMDEAEYRGMAIGEFWNKMSPIYDKFTELQQEEVIEQLEARGQV